ncbi:hypothetical protein EPUL_005509 [Erysiphe pulchra]|uniref:Uncharacterized protein n=1 Tax=Erysiphe pulchra TaxID=225359 RepID=A0A2S4PPV9_9PEZI|nr:hypothetical protein EPUL_005509 [Erysiphe pulchra]
MSSRGRGKTRGGSGGRSNAGISKPTKKNAVRNGVKRGNIDSSPDPPRIRVLKARKAELATSFKIIGSHQKSALLALAQKSLDATKSDTKYHENLSEFQVLCEDIDNKLDCIMSKLEERRDMNKNWSNQQCKVFSILKFLIESIAYHPQYKLKDLQEEAIARVQERVIYIEKMSKSNSKVNDIAFYNGEDGRKITKLAAPPKIVHPVAIPFSGVQLADGKSIQKLGDNLLEQHPANFWASCSDEKKRKLTNQLVSTIEKNRKITQNEKYGICRKRSGTANSLLNLSTASAIETEIEEDDPQLDEPSTAHDANTQDDQENIYELSDDAAELPLDSYGVRIPKKKMRAGTGIRPNNYIVTPRSFNFMDAEGQVLQDGSIGIQEIGIRTWTTRKNIRNRDYYIGCSVSPNPDNFYIPQRVGDVNSGNNTLEDMESVKHITETHKTHPKLGVVLPESINYDYQDLKDPYFPPPTCKNYPVKNLKQHMIIQENSDGTTTVFKIPRSWIHQTNKDFENITSRKRVADVLGQIDNLDKPVQHSPEPVTKPAGIDPDLISAVSAALEENEKNMLKIKEAEKTFRRDPKETVLLQTPRFASKTSNKPSSRTPTKITQRTSTKATKRPSRLQYDPVRDSFPAKNNQDQIKQDSLAKNNPRTSKQNIPPRSCNLLTELANYALNNQSIPVLPVSRSKNPSNFRPNVPSVTSQSALPLNPQIIQRQTQLPIQPPAKPSVQPPVQPPVQLPVQPPVQPPVQYIAQHPTQPSGQFSGQFSSQRSTERHPNSVQSQDPSGSLQSISQLVSPQSSHGITIQQYQQNQSTMSPFAFQYPMAPHQSHAQGAYQPHRASQMTYTPQLPPPMNYVPHPPPRQLNYSMNNSTMTNNIPPHHHFSSNPINYATRSLISTGYNPHPPHPVAYTSQSSSQPMPHSSLESNRIRELRPPNLQQNSAASIHTPVMHSWSTDGNYHSNSFKN